MIHFDKGPLNFWTESKLPPFSQVNSERSNVGIPKVVFNTSGNTDLKLGLARRGRRRRIRKTKTKKKKNEDQKKKEK